jgi:aldehyde:ferredoxin oxidoreductase
MKVHKIEAHILKIDLTTRSYEIEEIPKQVIKKYLGGRGLGAYLLYKSVPGGADPLGEENHLIFTAGPASGTNFYYSSKVNLNTKSPLTGIYLYSISSGILGHQMRKAGFWAIDIKGIADSPTYLMISDQDIHFKDAAHLWGKSPAEAQSAMLERLSPNKVASISIGPAGEKLIKYAAVFGEGARYRCFGRGGTGCVMGSKRLKGMVVKGTGKINIPDKTHFGAAKRGIANKLETDWKKWRDQWCRYETGADLQMSNELGIIPTRNWQTGKFEGWHGIDKSVTPMGWPDKSRPCAPYCLSPGTRDAKVMEGPYKGAHSDLEWETIYAFGSTCGIDKMEALIAASQLCDEFGVDTMSAGVTIGFAMECFERGLIGLEDTNGIDLRFGNDKAMIEILKQLVRNEGLGKRIAQGTKRLSEEIKGSEAFAMHVKGLELGGYECRGLNGQALQFAIDNRGGCHHGYGLPARAEVMDGTRLDIKGKGEQVKNLAIGRIIGDSLPFCTFLSGVITMPIAAEVITSLLGEPWSVDDLKTVGLRTICHERLFNMREGISEINDTLPKRLLCDPKPDGPTQGYVVPLKELKEDYYAALGWHSNTGNPTDAVLDELGIER